MREKGKPRITYVPQLTTMERKRGKKAVADMTHSRVPLSDVETNQESHNAQIAKQS